MSKRAVPMSTRAGGWGFGLLVAALGGAALLEHGLWAAACTWPIVRGDGPRHAIFAISRVAGWADGGAGPLGWLLEPMYYPAFTTVTAWPVLWAGSMAAGDVRLSYALYTGVLVAGLAVMGWRVGGRRLGLAGGLAVLTVPLLWALRVDVMLDVPLAAMVAAFLASLPLVGKARFRWHRAVACGVLLSIGMLTKQAMPYMAAPALAWVGLPALFRAAQQRRGWTAGLAVGALAVGGLGVAGALFVKGHSWIALGVVAVGVVASGWLARSQRAAHLGELTVVGGTALLLAGPWYARSVGPLLEGLQLTRAAHSDVPEGLAGVFRMLGMTPFSTHHLLPAPWAIALLVGLPVLPWLVRRRPLLGPALAAFVGGQLFISSFPDLHARHYAPLVGPLLLLAVGTLDGAAAVLKKVQLGGALRTGVVMCVAAHAGLMVASGWGGPRLSPMKAADLRIPGVFPPVDGRALMDILLSPPKLVRGAVPLPDTQVLPLHDALRAIDADRRKSGAEWAGLLLVTQRVEVTGLVLARDEVGAPGLFVVEPAGRGGLHQTLRRGYAVYTIELPLDRLAGRSSPQTAWLDAESSEPFLELDADLAEDGGLATLRVRRLRP